jgi:hypothetical protein
VEFCWLAFGGDGLRAPVVELLEELMGRELDVFVSPLSGPIVARDHAHPMDTAKVPIDEGVPRLGLFGRPIREPEMSLGVLVPGV